MKKIVKGNDFTLRIPVMKMMEGQAQAFLCQPVRTWWYRCAISSDAIIWQS
nr:hypothetical protein [uncultured Prevotella sp.]